MWKWLNQVHSMDIFFSGGVEPPLFLCRHVLLVRVSFFISSALVCGYWARAGQLQFKPPLWWACHTPKTHTGMHKHTHTPMCAWIDKILTETVLLWRLLKCKGGDHSGEQNAKELQREKQKRKRKYERERESFNNLQTVLLSYPFKTHWDF